MRKRFTHTWMACAFLVSTLSVEAQSPCPVKGIRTNPTNFYDPEHPAVVNPFNWLAPGTDEYRINWNLNSVPTQTVMPTPFSQASNNPPLDFKKTSPDKSADGWELIKQELGYNDDGSLRSTCVNPYVIVYNKYLGILRVYYAIGARQGGYAYSRMELSYDTDNDVTHKTGALNHISAIGVPLQDTKRGKQDGFVVVNKFDNVQGDWFMSDFPMDYDPCTCLNEAKFSIAITLIMQSHITLDGNIKATLTSIDNGASTGPNAANSSSSRSTLNYINGALTAGYSSYNGLSDFLKNVPKKDGSNTGAVQQLGGALAAPVPAGTQPKSFFDTAAGVVPYLGAALSILDYFVGGGQEAGPQQVVVQPIALDGTISLSGNITADLPWGGTDIRVPGSKLGTVLPQTPYYNEILGIFNLLEAPAFNEHIVDSGDGVTHTTYLDLDHDLSYVVNPASGLILHSMSAAVLQTESGNYAYGQPDDFLTEEIPGVYAPGQNSTNSSYPLVYPTYRTDYVDSGCLSNYTFAKTYVDDSYYYDPGNPPPSPVLKPSNRRLKLMLDFTRVDGGKDVLLVLVYPINIISTGLGYPVFRPNTPCSTPLLPAQSPAAVTAFCNSNPKYTAAVALPRASLAGPTKPRASQKDLTQFTAFPNPTESTTTIRFAVEETGPVHLYLRDGLGRTVRDLIKQSLSPGLLDKQLDTQDLAPGIYYAVLQTNNRLQTLKIVVDKP